MDSNATATAAEEPPSALEDVPEGACTTPGEQSGRNLASAEAKAEGAGVPYSKEEAKSEPHPELEGEEEEGRPSPSPEPADRITGLQAQEDRKQGSSEAEAVGIAAGRRTIEIKPKSWAGSVVWAKLAKYPWWPAQVLSERDPWIPQGSEPPRRGAVPVRFFGTYDFGWIESQRAIVPFDHGTSEHSTKSKAKVFLDALAEANHFQAGGDLPEGFAEESSPSPQKQPRGKRSTGGRQKGRRGDGVSGASGKGGKRGLSDADDAPRHASVRERQDSIMRSLALVPPPESPYAHSICLDGIRRLITG